MTGARRGPAGDHAARLGRRDQPAGLRRRSSSGSASSAAVVEAPLRRQDDGRYDLDPDALDRGSGASPASRLPAVQPAQPDSASLVREQLRPSPTLPAARRRPARRRDPRAARAARRTVRAVRVARPRDHPARVHVSPRRPRAGTSRASAALAVAGSAAARGALTAGLLPPPRRAAVALTPAWLDAGCQSTEPRAARRLLAEQLPGSGYVPPAAASSPGWTAAALGRRRPAAALLDAAVALARADFGAQGRLRPAEHRHLARAVPRWCAGCRMVAVLQDTAA